MQSRRLVLVACLLCFLASCGLSRQLREMQALEDCEFWYEGLEHATLAGVDVMRIAQVGELNPRDGAVLFAALAFGRLPLDLTVRVGVRNPNPTAAAVSRLDWILLIDDLEMGSGSVTDRFDVPAHGGTAVVPVHLSTELTTALSGKSGKSLIAFGLNLAGAGDRPSRITVKVRPTVYVGTRAVRFPGYLTLNQELSGAGAKGSQR